VLSDSTPLLRPNSLVESQLFGYVRGAFTGATQDKIGLFEHAHGGTIFMDEIGELAPAAQAKMLRVIQDHQVQRVGSPTARNIDVRVIAATHRNLKAMVREGSFREDLYYRLAVVEIPLPVLAKRREDLPLLGDISSGNSPTNTISRSLDSYGALRPDWRPIPGREMSANSRM
jgi:transcriptional regulator with PAS, ATPase and Fis domain